MGVRPPEFYWGKVIGWIVEEGEMQGYSMGEYNYYEVAALELPSKKGDFEGEGARTLWFVDEDSEGQEFLTRVLAVVAPNEDAAWMMAAGKVKGTFNAQRVKTFVRPFCVPKRSDSP